MAIDERIAGPSSIAIKGTANGEETVGVLGKGDAQGVRGEGGAVGVRGIGNSWHGVAGLSKSAAAAGVFGHHAVGGTGVQGESTGNGAGVWGEHKGGGTGVIAISKDGVGLAAQSAGNEAIHAETRSPGMAAIAAYNANPNGTGAAIFAKKEGPQGHAGFFDGNVWITGELGTGHCRVGQNLAVDGDIVLMNADCAEDFDIANAELIEPGTVMVVGEAGALHQCHQAYDKRVAGVISGAGDYKPGIVLDKQHSQRDRKPIALLGKTYCKVDAEHGAIEVGDLLTTSPTPGHAMKADDALKAFGAVIGKALRPLQGGRGLIPILIALQ